MTVPRFFDKATREEMKERERERKEDFELLFFFFIEKKVQRVTEP